MRQWVIFVAAFLIGLAVLPAGLVGLSSHPILGVLLTLSGEALLIQSLAGLRKTQPDQFDDGQQQL